MRDHLLAAALLALALAGCRGVDALPDVGPAGGAADAGRGIDGGAADAGSCGTRTGRRGLTHRSVLIDGALRTYLVYLPIDADATKPLPLVLVFHGFLQSGQAMVDITQYLPLADAEGIALAFPDGESGPLSVGAPWNVKDPGQSVCGYGNVESASGDDSALVDAMKADVANDQCVDAAHTYATGFSMGAYFTEHLGCYRTDLRAIAPHSGGTLGDLSGCPTGHVPIILFHGTSDEVISEACDDPTAKPDDGFAAAATLWARKNGCASTHETIVTDGAGGGKGQCYLYDGCPADGQVELCTFTGMLHCWAGGGVDANYCASWASATELEWSFWKKYAW